MRISSQEQPNRALSRGILHTCEDISEGATAGQQHVIAQLARHFTGQGWAVEVLGPVPNGGKVARQLAPFVRRKMRALWTPWGLLALRAAVRRASLVHIHGVWAPIGIAAAVIARMDGRPYVVTPHGMWQPWLLRRRRRRKQMHVALASRPMMRRASAVHCVTSDEARLLRRILASTRDLAVIPNAIEADWLVRADDVTLWTDRQPVVLFVGRLHPVKGVELLIDAWALVHPSFANWRLELAGPDTVGLRPSLQRQAERKGVAESVRFLGARMRPDLIELYDRASVFVLPSFTEVMGMANLEAAARAVPIVTSRYSGLDELATYGAGVLCAPSVEAIAAALRSMLELPEVRRREIGARALLMVRENFTWERVVGRFEDLYRRALGSDVPDVP